jgi:acyl-CoA synthetase (AMP-forming)/AMP-acid ligase II
MRAPVAAEGAATLVALLAYQAAVGGERTAYFFNDEPRTFGRLWSDVEAFAGALVRHAVQPGGRVVMALPNGHEFFTALYGVQRAGAIPVPIFPGFAAARVIEMAQLCGAQHIVAPAAIPPQQLASWRSMADGVRILTVDTEGDGPVALPEIQPEDIAYIQYTSGSTGDPKGVLLTHDNLLTNVRQMVAGMEITPRDRFVSWLPTYHDMGLTLMTMVPFYLAAPLYLLPTTLRDTKPWLEAITRHRGTFTASPDFGYRMCLRQTAISADGIDAFDLTSLRVALNAAEPVPRSVRPQRRHGGGIRFG